MGLLNVAMVGALGGRLENAKMKRSLRVLSIRAEKVKIDVKYIGLLKGKLLYESTTESVSKLFRFRCML